MNKETKEKIIDTLEGDNKIKKEINYIQGMGEVLLKLADEVKGKGKFEDKDLELLKKIGSDILFKGCVLDYLL